MKQTHDDDKMVFASGITPGASTTLVDAGTMSVAGGREAVDPYIADDFHPLQIASSGILAALRADETSPDADLYRRIAAGTGPGSHMYRTSSASGGTGTDSTHSSFRGSVAVGTYARALPGSPNTTAGNVTATPPTPTVKHVRTVPLPDFLTRELATTKLSSLMGLLPEASLAWMSVDERLFLWAYDSAMGGVNGEISDYCCFSVPSGQCVVSVGLVRPKRGVFKHTVEWCLVVNTPEEAILCAVAREATARSSENTAESFGRDKYDNVLRLVPTSFVVPTDSVPILSVCGTNDGRIFLGGYDGKLYEMMYDSLAGGTHRPAQSDDQFDEDFEYEGSTPLHFHPSESLASTIMSGTKRALSAAVFGPSPPSAKRARKCRKVSHSAVAPSFVSAVVPGFVLRAASAVFGSDTSNAGPIVSMTMDEERKTLYALTSRGYVHAFDLRPPSMEGTSSSNLSGPALSPHPPRLACTVNCPLSARRFLDSIARGRSWPPGAPSDRSIANVTYPGGANGAKAAVGGMEGARAVIKAFDAEGQRRQQLRRARRDGRRKSDGRFGSNWRRAYDGEQGILCPVSIHIVPCSESKVVTLVAITGGGLRYYISALSSTSGNSEILRPGGRFTLCHIKAPPPYKVGTEGEVSIDSGSGSPMVMNGGSSFGRLDGSVPPGIANYRNAAPVERAYHGRDGVTLLALDCGSVVEGGRGIDIGDAIVALTPDPSNACRPGVYGTMGSTPSDAGLGEVLSLPMAFSGQSKTGRSCSVLPGGRVWDIAAAASIDSVAPKIEAYSTAGSVHHLLAHSATPTDVELRLGIIPAYFPPSRVPRRTENKLNIADQAAHSPLVLASSSTGILSNAPVSAGVVVSHALNIMSRILLRRPLYRPHSLLEGSNSSMRVGETGIGAPLTYRISRRVGASALGFGPGAAGKITSTSNSLRPSVSVPRSRGPSSYGRKAGRSVAAKSARLSPWLLSPRVAPLPDWAKQHLTATTAGIPGQGGMDRLLALNSGGLHFFATSSPMDSLASALMKSNTSGGGVGRDEDVRSFFDTYGYTEGCAMCLAIVVGDGSDALRKKAEKAALSFAHVPRLMPHSETGVGPTSSNLSGTASGISPTTSVPGLPGYTFHPSNLHDGLLSLLSRLLRPFWYKPAVVVTEGRTIIHQGHYVRGYRSNTPARVELLLDTVTTEEVRRPLVAFCKLMRDIFNPAVGSVPGGNKTKGDAMEIDDVGGTRLITQAMRQQNAISARTASGSSGAVPGIADGHRASPKELEDTARLLEERNMHSLYRVASRSCQLLALISHLREAQSMQDLPEVEWGMLHGLTHCQLVTTREGQDRLETVLTSLISGGMDFPSNMTGMLSGTADLGGPPEMAQSDRLSLLLSQSCYLYYSAGSRLTYLGFRTARSAALDPPGSPRRVEMSNRASTYFVRAAAHWYNPGLVTGRVLHANPVPKRRSNSGGNNGSKVDRTMADPGWYDDAAMRALQHGSPLARAAEILVELGDVGGTVDVCLRCAANFGGVLSSRKSGFDGDELEGTEYGDMPEEMLSWERGLYHRPLHVAIGRGGETNPAAPVAPSTPSGRSIESVVSGMDVTPIDALMTCHAILFHHLSNLLNAASQFPEMAELADRMISVCSSSSDPEFLCCLYEYLIITENADVLLRIDSPSLEAWLRDERKDIGLLWRYYARNGRDALAGETMRRRGCAKDERVHLDERIECLTKALNSFTTAASAHVGDGISEAPRFSLKNGEMSNTATNQWQRALTREELARITTQVKEQLEVAHLQRRILDATRNMSSSSLDDAKSDALSFSLVSATDLYNDFAAPLALYDLCLLMLCTCGNNDPVTISTLWRSILSEEVLPCRTRSPEVFAFVSEMSRGSMVEEDCQLIRGVETGDNALMLFEDGDWVPRLKDRVSALGSELYGEGADYTFPLDLLVEWLEGLRRVHESTATSSNEIIGSISHGSSKPWTLQVFLDAGVRFSSLLEAYDTVLFARDNGTSRQDQDVVERLYNLSSICHVLELWSSAAFSPNVREEGTSNRTTGTAVTNDAFVQLSQAVSSGGLLQRIDVYKTSLESSIGNADEVSRVYSMFRDVEDCLRQKM